MEKFLRRLFAAARRLLSSSDKKAPFVLLIALATGTTDASAFERPSGFPAFSVAAGGAHTCSVGQSGGVKCAGYNDFGQLGDGTTISRYNPVTAQGVTGAVQVTAGGAHTCALTSRHDVYCWGQNTSGQLGDGTTTNRSNATAVPGLYEVKAIAAGLDRTCALLLDGGVSCWGDNTNGALGDGTTEKRLTPVRVHGLKDVIALTAGIDHTCALSANGEVACWGGNEHGALGDGGTESRSVPARVEGLANVRKIAAGYQFTCAVKSDGDVVCWGNNERGNIGDGTTMDRLIPTPVVGLSEVLAVGAGTGHTCAIRLGGAVYCWGNNYRGDLGIGSNLFQKAPVEDSPVPDWMVDITGNPLQVNLNYPNPFTSTIVQHTPDLRTPFLAAVMQAPLPGLGSGSSLKSTPLNSLFDYFWSVAPAPSGTGTLQQQSSATLGTSVCQVVNNAGHSCSNVVVHVPSTGALGAEAGQCQTGPLSGTSGGGLVLEYILSGAEVDFTSDGGTTWKVPVDIYISWGTMCSATPANFAADGPAFAEVDVGALQATNVAASVVQFFADLVFQLLLNQPPPGGPVGATQSFNFGAISQLLNQFAQVCRSEEAADGFTQFAMSADPNTHTLSFTMTHPANSPPVPYNKATLPNLLGALINVAPSTTVEPGGQLDVSGFGFTPNQAIAIDLGWSPSSSGLVRYSLFPSNSPNAITVPAQNGNFLLTGLQLGTSGSFMVSSCDPVTCTPFSSPPLTIGTTGSLVVTLALDKPTAAALAAVSPDTAGSISIPVTIPIATSPGAHTLLAVVAGAIAAPPVTIFVKGSGAPPFIQVSSDGQQVSTSVSTVPGIVLEGHTVTVNGVGFPSGGNVIVTSNGSGPTFGSVLVQPDGTFSMSFSLSAPLGNQAFVAATQPANVQASAPVLVENVQ